MQTAIKRSVVTGDFVERVNKIMIAGKGDRRLNTSQQAPAKVKTIISSAKQSENEMRSRFSAALHAAG